MSDESERLDLVSLPRTKHRQIQPKSYVSGKAFLKYIYAAIYLRTLEADTWNRSLSVPGKDNRRLILNHMIAATTQEVAFYVTRRRYFSRGNRTV